MKPEDIGSSPNSEGEVTLLLRRWQRGDPEALSDLVRIAYGDLHSIASVYMRGERAEHTLQPTALVNELYLRLLQQRKVAWDDRVHFCVFAAHVMRNILTDHARSHLAERRGGQFSVVLPISEEIAWVGDSPEHILDLSRALEQLERIDSRKAQLIELRFYLALTMPQAAEVLGVSLATAERDLKFARAWLLKELGTYKGRLSGDA